MGNCCPQKKDKKKPAQGAYKKAPEGEKRNSAHKVAIKADATDGVLLQDQETARDLEGGKDNVEVLMDDQIELDPEILKIIDSLNLPAELDNVKTSVETYNLGELKKLTDDKKDTFEMHFDVKTDDAKEKIHAMYFKSKTHLDPAVFKLVSHTLSEEEEKKLDDNYERVYTMFRAKIGEVHYTVQYALYKKIMFFNKKDLVIIKAFKKFDNGDVAEIAISIDHPEFPETPKIDRMKLIKSQEYVKKLDSGSEVTTVSQIYPRVGTGFMILKPVYTSMFRNSFKILDEFLKKVQASEEELTRKYEGFKKEAY